MTVQGHPALIEYPQRAWLGRVVPKNRILAFSNPGRRVRDHFTDQVAQIAWQYKLAPETVNLPATPAVTEIQVFRVTLKGLELDQDVLRTIDRAIPSPLIFELVQGERIKMVAAYKRPAQNQKGETDPSRWVVGNYFETSWLPESSNRQPLPVALDMAGLYEKLLSPLVQSKLTSTSSDAQEHALNASNSTATSYNKPANAGQEAPLSLEQRIAMTEAIALQQKQVDRIKARLGREKQFNKRVAINAELRDAKEKLQRLRDHHERTE